MHEKSWAIHLLPEFKLFYGMPDMQNINYRANATSHPSSLGECGHISDNDSPQNKARAFSSRTCVVALATVSAVGVMGAVYYLVSSQGSVQQSPLSEPVSTSLSERKGTPICFNPSQYTYGTGMHTPDNNDIYCTYPDQRLPGQMAELVNHGIVRVIEHAGNLIYHGAKNIFECINHGLTWRQNSRESECVFMDSDTCRSLGGHPSYGSSACGPAIDLDGSADVLCTKDWVRLCRWRNK